MKYQIYFLLVILILACRSPEESFVGQYKTNQPNKLAQGFNRVVNGQLNIIGSELSLKEDSTFSYVTCANIFKGHWKAKNDTLLLFVESNRWANDSLNQYGFYGEKPEVSNKPIKFEIVKDGFRQDYFVELEGESLTAIEKLERVE